MDPAAVALLAYAVRLAYFAEYRRSPFYDFLHLDPRYYHDWALTIAKGDWLGREVFEQSPLYPYLLALYFLAFGKGLFVLRLLQFALGSLTAALTAVLGRRLFGRAAGIAAGAGAALYGPFLFYEGQVMKEFLTPLFSVAMLLLVDAGSEARARGDPAGARRARLAFAAAGAVIGLAALVRDNFLLLLPLLAGWAALSGGRGAAARAATSGGAEAAARAATSGGAEAAPPPGARRPARARLLDAGALAAGALAALLPVAARNYAVAGEIVLTTSGGGEVFYIGNGPYANGAYAPPPWVRANPLYEHEDFRRRAREITGRDLTRAEASRFWWREGWKTITDNLDKYPRLLLRKALLFLNDHELPDNYSFYSFRTFSRVLSALPTFAWAAALAGPGIVLSAARWRRLLPLYLSGAGYMASVMIFFNFARFRLPFIPILLLFAGHGAAALWGMARGGAARAWRRAAGFAAAGAACLAVVFLEIPAGTEDPFQDRLHLGAAYRQAGRLEEAERVFRETIRDAEDLLARHGWTRGSPVFPAGVTFRLALHAAHRDLAGILADQGRLDEAIEQYAAAIPSDPNDVDLYARLGGAHRKKGEFAAAARAYERGLAVEPGSFVLRFDLATALYEAGDPRAALSELLRAGEALPRLPPLDQADWHYGMGTVLHAIPGREAEAIAHFREALRRNPSHPQAVEVRRILGASR